MRNTDYSISKRFFKYVSQNVAGSLGISCYIIVDTFFIAKAAGANGLTTLNLALPFFGMIFALGALIGVGSATRYGIDKARGAEGVNRYLGNALFWEIMCSIPFILLGIFFPGQAIRLMKGDDTIVGMGIPYFRIILCFAPLFMMQHTVTGFIRNDNDTVIAMIATISGSLFNILFDYIFMFVFGWGMMGAALATAAAPIVCISICTIHFHLARNTIHLFPLHISFMDFVHSIVLGISAFVGEFASAVTTAVFNFLIMDLAGNIGIAAYGVVANYAIVITAICGGIANGCQPLLSEYYGRGETANERAILRRGIVTAVVIAAVITGLVYRFTDPLVHFFNSEGNATLAEYARMGMRLYFPGYLVAGMNIVLVGYFAATEKVKSAMATSVLRGVIAIVACAFVLSMLFGMNGIWSAFAAAEAITCVVAWVLYIRLRKTR